MYHNARIAAQSPGQLAMPDIHGAHFCRTSGEQNIGEATSGGADIDADFPQWREGKISQRMIEFQPAARNPWVILASDIQRRILREHVAGLGDAAIGGKNLAGEDQRLRAGTRLNQAAVEQ